MSWKITGVSVPFDNDAWTYIRAVETADGQILEQSVRNAITNFVLGCKADGIWDAIKASCILAGARTLAGALVPLVGTAPTNYNFVAGDYNRQTGLKGDESTKYLDSNYAYGSSLENNKHVSVFASTVQQPTVGVIAYAGSSKPSPFDNVARTQLIVIDTNNLKLASRCSDETTTLSAGNNNASGMLAVSRSSSVSYTQRGNSISETVSSSSITGAENNMFVFARNNTSSNLPSNARLAFYSIGEALDLALLDSRVTTLINAIAAAIP